MKVFHIVHQEPFGPTWIAYLEKPDLPPSEICERWIIEVELEELMSQFANHISWIVQVSKEELPCVLSIRLRYENNSDIN